MNSYKITEKATNDISYVRFQKSVAEKVGVTPQAIQKQWKRKGFFENSLFKVEKINIL